MSFPFQKKAIAFSRKRIAYFYEGPCVFLVGALKFLCKGVTEFVQLY